MSSDVPVSLANRQLVQGSKPPVAATGVPASGKSLPQGDIAAAAVAGGAAIPAPPVSFRPDKPPAPSNRAPAGNHPTKAPPDLHASLAHLNKLLQSSGRANRYKLDSSGGQSVIQEINPDTNKVISEIPASEFRELAQELGVSGVLVDTRV